MPLQSNVWFGAVAPASVPTPAAGYYALFVADGTSSTVAGYLYKKDPAGVVSSAQDHTNDFTNAKAQDAVGGALQSSDTISLTYNTGGRFITANVNNGSITATHIIDGSITGAKIADSAIIPAKLADLAVTSIKLADLAVTTSKLADGAVGTTKIADASITNAKMAAMAAGTFRMRATGTGTGQPIDGTAAQAKTALAITVSDVSGLGSAATMNSTAFDAAGAATTAANAAQAAAIAAANTAASNAQAAAIAAGNTAASNAQAAAIAAGNTAASNAQAAAIAAANTAASNAQAAAIAASQPLDADLTAIAALTTTAYGRSLLTVPDVAAATAGLNAATQALKGLMSSTDKAKLDALSITASTFNYNVRNYGIDFTNSAAANLAAWNALIPALPDNASITFPPSASPYQFSGTLAIPAGKHFRITGSSNQKSIIQTTSATADIFSVGDWYNEFNGLKLSSSVTRTGGAAINSGNNVAINVYNCDFDGMWDGIVYTGGVNAGNLAMVVGCGFTGTLNRGIVLDGTNANTILERVTMDGTAGVQQVGLELLQCGSVLVSNCDFIRAQNNLRFNPASPNGVFSAYFVNVFFDTASASAVRFQGTGNVQRVKFTNCWFSGSVTGCEFNSTAATLPTAIDFINCDIFGNSSRGIYANGVQDFNVTNSRIAGNTTAGIETVASTGSVTKFNVANNTIGPTAGFGANGTGVLINAGTYGGYAMKNNDLRNNTTNNLTDNGSVATTDLKIINDNFGHLITGSIGNIATQVGVGGTAVILSARVPAKAATAGQVFRFKVIGLAASSLGTLIFRVYVGANGNTSDTVVWTSQTSAAQTANWRSGFEGLLTVRTAGAAGTVQCEALGFANTALLPTVVAAVAAQTVNTNNPWFVTLGVTSSVGNFNAQQAVVEAL